MRWLVATMALLAAAAGLNTASVAVQQRYAVLTRRLGHRGWYVHLAAVIPPWVGVVLLLPHLGRHVRWPLPPAVRPFGTPVLLASGLLWLTAFRQLGPTRTGNGNLFGHGDQGRVTGGVFRWLANPMYDSYVLALVGAAVRSANAVYLLVAAEAAALLRIEARVENRPFATRADTQSARSKNAEAHANY